MNKQTRTSWVLHLVAVFALAIAFGFLYFTNHAWGTWGDDSAGYIYLAGQMEQGEPLVYDDPIATAGITFFENEKLARWLTPTHHEFIHPDGTIASKYPIGTSMLLYAGSIVTGDSSGFYIVTPGLAVLSLVLLYTLVQVLLPKQRFRHVIGLAAAIMLGLSGLYFDYAVAQPMREIPSIFFLLLFSVLFALSLRYHGKKWLHYGLTACAALAMGMAMNIRETTLLVLPGAVAFGAIALWKAKTGWKDNVKRLLPTVGVFLGALIIGVLPTIWNSYTISVNNEPFKARDVGDTVLLSNANHIQSLSVENVLNNDGKFRNGEGSLPHYWKVMQNATPLTYFLVFAVFGLWFFWKQGQWGKATAVFLSGWILGILTIFAMWVNPYSRYIMPLFPPLLLLTGVGGYAFIAVIIPRVFADVRSARIVQGALVLAVCVTTFYSYQPVVKQLEREFATRPTYLRFKSITQNDLGQLRALGDQLNDQATQPVLLFSGEWQYGTSETFQAHTGVKTIRSPFEQKFQNDFQLVDRFFQTELIPKYDLFIWVDDTTEKETRDWLAQQNAESIAEYAFSFENNVSIYRVTP
jgi:hypothetical protein